MARKDKRSRLSTRGKKIISATNSISVLDDIAANGPVLYGSSLTYIHNTRTNFLAGAAAANRILASHIGTLIAEWKAQSQYLIQVCAENENNFFTNLNASGNNFNKETFEQQYQQMAQPYILNYNNIVQALSKHSVGKKFTDEIMAMGKEVQSINNLVQALNTSVTSNGINPADLQKFQNLLNKYNDCETYCKQTQRMHTKELDATGQELVKGLSVTSLMLQTLPRTLELIVFQGLYDAAGNIVNVQDVTSQTKTGSSADGELFGGYFSIKSDGSQIKQAKTRMAETFFNWEQGLDDSTPVGAMHRLLSSQDDNNVSLQSALEYIILNYGSFHNAGDGSILKEAWRVLILSNLNEKLFGFNKQGQTNLSELLKKMPIATISSNKFIWMSDMLRELIDDIDKDVNTISSLATCGLSSAFYNNSRLIGAKKNALKVLRAKGTVNYTELKNYAEQAIRDAVQELKSSIMISIQYHIDTPKE